MLKKPLNHQLTIALVEPKIPQNTGNIGRLCAATNTNLHLVGEMGFQLDDKHLKRAGLDYWPHVNYSIHSSTEDYMNSLDADQIVLLSSKATKLYTEFTYTKNSILILGSETQGLAEKYRKKYKHRCATIPMMNDQIRCLNLSNSTSIVLYEAIRQLSTH